MPRTRSAFPLLASLVLALQLTLTGCATNPVTGATELQLVSYDQAIALGVRNYEPMQQAEGGEYRLDPALNQYLKQVGMRLAAVSDRELPYEFVVLNNSIPNAWALPGGKIAVNRGLLTELDSEAELAAVLGHEIVHAAAGHSRQAMQRGLLIQGALLTTAVAAHDSDYANIAIAGASIAAQLVNQRYGRQAELDSDYYGMGYMSRAGYDPSAAISLQQTFVRLSEGRSSDWLSGLFASHPPSEARVAANQQHRDEFPAGGQLGKDEFQRMMRKTRNAIPAYTRYDEGRKALAEKQPERALSLAREAIKLEPREAHFYALRGDARFLQKDYQKAIVSYDAALQHNSEFFYYYLQRGLSYERLRQDAKAQADLQASIELLPSAPAYLALGNIDARNNNIDAAIANYRIAANAEGSTGQAAQAALLRLDLPRNPQNYVQLRSGLDDQGQLIVQMANPTTVPLADISLLIRYRDSRGGVRELRRDVRGSLAAGTSTQLATGLGPFTSTEQYRVTVNQARIAR